MSITIDLSAETEQQFQRVKRLAVEADDDDSADSLSSRATAMRALTDMIKTLTESQEKLINIKRLNCIEQALITLVKDTMQPRQYEDFLNDLEARLSTVNE